jgi:coenzyme F420 biosynthesis associated uncharacterized protein
LSARPLVDWRLAERTAVAVAGGAPVDAAGAAGAAYDQPRLEDACAEAIETASAYARLPIPARPAEPELIDRSEWSRMSIATLAAGSAAIEARVAGEIRLPGPLDAIGRRLLAAGTAAEAGLAVGFVARRVLGQYDIAVFGPDRPGRLVFVAPNLDAARVKLGADADLFLRWIALHETTHVLQLEGVPWIVPQLRALAGRLVEAAAREVDPARVAELARRFARNPGEVARRLLRGELMRVLADPSEAAVLDRLQATMAVVEGHAEHVMDICGAELDPRLADLRDRLDRQRSARGGLGEVIARLLGLELKLRQYELGKRFWDTIVADGGEDALALPWRSPADLPDLAELEQPAAWLERVGARSAAPVFV